MPTLSEPAIATLLTPYLPSVPTSIRHPAEIVRRHFGESLFAAQHLGNPDTLLDLGSGAGFPGLPIALLHPEIHVTLAESQNKKATFLREVVRTLNIPVEIW